MQGTTPRRSTNEPLSTLEEIAKHCLAAFSVRTFARLQLGEIRQELNWMLLSSVPEIILLSSFVALALTLQTVIELRQFKAADLAGSVIAVGLLRELGPLIVSSAWCAKVAAGLCSQTRELLLKGQSSRFSSFLCTRLVAALIAAVPLSAYGLFFGLLTGAALAPHLGSTSTADFLENARQSVKDKDLCTFFLKLCLINPTAGVFCGCITALRLRLSPSQAVVAAVGTTTVAVACMNWITTALLYW